MIANCCNTEPENLTVSDVKFNMRYQRIPAEELWREDILNDLLLQRRDDLTIDEFEKEEIDSLIELVCIS